MSRKVCIAELTESYDSEGYSKKCIAHCYVGGIGRGNLWTVWEYNNNGVVNRYLDMAIMQCYNLPDNERTWGYKDCGANAGFDNCPLSYLDMVNESEYPVLFEKVRAFHAEEKKKREFVKNLKIGETYKLSGRSIPEVTIISTKPLIGTYGWNRYKVTHNMFAI